MEPDLIGYLLRLEDDDVLARLEMDIRSDPALARRLAVAARALAPLEADREPPAPAADLVSRTVGQVARRVVESGEIPGEEPVDLSVHESLASLSPQRLRELIEVMDRAAATPTSHRRVNVIIASSILLLAVGLVLATVPYVRHRQNIAACQNNLRDLHFALMNYGDTHGGQFPQVKETPPHNTAASFSTMLRDAGMLPGTASLACPAVVAGESGYAYSLGYREFGGQLKGLRREDDLPTNDLLPILADRPPPSRLGVNPDHATGQNVLYVGGHVSYCTSTKVGVNGDDIYRNQFGVVGAGLNRWDTVLGIGSDVP
jgi:hypothetical protein